MRKFCLCLIGVQCCSVVLLSRTAEHNGMQYLIVIVLVIVSAADNDEDVGCRRMIF